MIYLLVLCLLLGGAPALAAPWAQVDALWVAAPDGEWAPVQESGAATAAAPEAAPAPLYVGMELLPGVVITSSGARVRILIEGDQQILIEPESALTLEEQGVLQQIGAALYEVEGLFRVRYGAVEAAVEGTRFSVEGGETVIVSVLEGKVRVSSGGESVLVERGQAALAGQTSPPTPPAEWSPELRDALRLAERGLGEPRLSLALMSGGGLSLESLTSESRVMLRYRLTRGLRLVAETGLHTDGEVFYLPQGLGLEQHLGPVGIGGNLTGYVGQETDLCEGTTRLRVIPGGNLSARLRIPLPGSFALETQARLGWTGAPTADLSLGVSYGL